MITILFIALSAAVILAGFCVWDAFTGRMVQSRYTIISQVDGDNCVIGVVYGLDQARQVAESLVPSATITNVHESYEGQQIIQYAGIDKTVMIIKEAADASSRTR